MQFATFLTLPTLALGIALPQTTTPNTCFPSPGGRCLGRQIPVDTALTAIGKACAQITTCTQGAPKGNRVIVTGKVPQYTATLDVGIQCAGIANWSQEACVALFKQQVDDRCQAQFPSDLYQRE